MSFPQKEETVFLFFWRMDACQFFFFFLFVKQIPGFAVELVNGTVLYLLTDTRIEPKHSLPAHTVVELWRGRVLARAICPQHRSEYAEYGLPARRGRPRTPACHLVHRARLLERLKPKSARIRKHVKYYDWYNYKTWCFKICR